MLALVANISLQDVVDAYLRAQTERLGQTEMGKRIGTKRQGVNAIVNGKEGRRFTMRHLEKYAQSTGISTSTLLADLATLAWKGESELRPKPELPTSLSLVPPEQSEEASLQTVAELLRALLEETRKRR